MIPLVEGSVLAGLYRVQRSFRGGMGSVHQARHLGWGIDVAIKHPLPEFLKSPELRRAFEHECRLWSELGMHPNIVTCFYTRVIANQLYAFAEFVPGGSLGDLIRSRQVYIGDEHQVLFRLFRFASQMACGLRYAHSRGVIHCDVKPANALIDTDDSLRISDFGISRAIDSGRASGGTPAYWSPEQANSEKVGPESDIWCWAVSVLELFSGGLSWQSGIAAPANLEELIDRGGKAVGVPAVPEGLLQLLRNCLVFDRARRVRGFDTICHELTTIEVALFGESTWANVEDVETFAADSDNNRALAAMDLGEPAKALSLLRRALEIDPLHPEANFNLACMLGDETTFKTSLKALESLLQMEPLNEPARRLATAITIPSERKKARFSRPISGADLHADRIHFDKLATKLEATISSGRIGDARFTLRLIDDMDGFSRHPRVRRARQILENQ
jgi:serine/threonine protein kinase